MAEFEMLDSYICPYCGHAESIHLCGWGGPPEHMKCPVCYEMMDLVREDDGNEGMERIGGAG